MSTADGGAPLKAAEFRSLFADLTDHPVLVLAVSGGPDSTALLWLAARWRKSLKTGPKLVAVTVDHGLRPEARREALAVKRLARSLGIGHRTLRWTGHKPKTGLQQAARLARYRPAGRSRQRQRVRSTCSPRHTLDDQAETVLIRLARGSGIGGLAAMARVSPLPARCGHHARAAAARCIESAAGRDLATGPDRLCRRPEQPRPALHAGADSRQRCRRSSARASKRGGSRCWRAGSRRAETALETMAADAFAELAPQALCRGRDRSNFRQRAMRNCRPRSACACLAVPSPRSATKGPSSSEARGACMQGLSAAAGTRGFAARWQAPVTLVDGRLLVERAPTRRGKTAPKRP